MGQEGFGIREGELAMSLPARQTPASLSSAGSAPLGTHRERCRKSTRESHAAYAIEIDPLRRRASGRGELIAPVFWMNNSRRELGTTVSSSSLSGQRPSSSGPERRKVHGSSAPIARHRLSPSRHDLCRFVGTTLMFGQPCPFPDISGVSRLRGLSPCRP